MSGGRGPACHPEQAFAPWDPEVAGFAAGMAISFLTSPVGISGAVFLLPVQIEVLNVPSPQVTPTNLLFNVVAVPGALLRYAVDMHWLVR